MQATTINIQQEMSGFGIGINTMNGELPIPKGNTY